MIRRAMAGLLCGTVSVVLASSSAAHAQTTTSSTVVVETVVTVEGGPAQPKTFRGRCTDVIVNFDEQLSFVLRRTGPTTAPLTVTYAVSGSAQAGVHYEPLPGSATFPAGASTVTISVVPRQTPQGALVELTLRVTGGTPRRLVRRRGHNGRHVHGRHRSLPPRPAGHVRDHHPHRDRHGWARPS